jgi:hypothetical protein
MGRFLRIVCGALGYVPRVNCGPLGQKIKWFVIIPWQPKSTIDPSVPSLQPRAEAKP